MLVYQRLRLRLRFLLRLRLRLPLRFTHLPVLLLRTFLPRHFLRLRDRERERDLERERERDRDRDRDRDFLFLLAEQDPPRRAVLLQSPRDGLTLRSL